MNENLKQAAQNWDDEAMQANLLMMDQGSLKSQQNKEYVSAILRNAIATEYLRASHQNTGRER